MNRSSVAAGNSSWFFRSRDTRLTHGNASRTGGHKSAVSSRPRCNKDCNRFSPPGRTPADAATRSRLAAIRLNRSCNFSPAPESGGNPSSVKAARTAAQ